MREEGGGGTTGAQGGKTATDLYNRQRGACWRKGEEDGDGDI